MSLLSGIRFVPKSERETIAVGGNREDKKRKQASTSSSSSSSSSDTESEDSDEDFRRERRRHRGRIGESERKQRDDKKHKKDKKDKKDHKKKKSRQHDKKKDNKKDRKRDKKDKNDQDESSSESEIDLEAFVREEEMREAEERAKKAQVRFADPARYRFEDMLEQDAAEVDHHQRYQDEEEDKSQQQKTTEEAPSFDPSRFRSLLTSLGGGGNASTPHASTSSTTIPSETANNATEASVVVPSNKNMAALLRARLKSTGSKALDAKVIEVDKQVLASGDSILADDFDMKRHMLLLNNKYNSSVTETGGKDKKKKASSIKSDFDSVDLKTLIGREKYGNDEDMDSVFRDNVLRLGERYKGSELGGTGAFGNGDRAGMDEEAEIDMKMFERRTVDPAEAMKKQVANAIKERQRMTQIVENCAFCFNSKRFPNQLLISRSENVVLRLKAEAYSLAPGHCEIIPLSHIASYVRCDEETRTEIERYKSCLRRFFETQGKNMVVMETAVNFDRRPHACIEVIPIAKGLEAEIHMFFKEAFMSCDEEWAQQKKIIEITADRPLTRAVPSQFSYLHAEWFISGDDDEATQQNSKKVTGLVHPIENDKSIHFAFCYDVLAGMMDEDEFRMRKGKPVAAGVEAKKVQQFKSDFNMFDWTQYDLSNTA